MYNLSALIIGALLALMVTFNGILAAKTNIVVSLTIINLVGLISAYILLLISREKKPSYKNIPLYLLSGGILSAGVVGINNVSFNVLGISLTTSILLIGQSFTSTIIDHFGLLNMKKIPFNTKKIPGFIIVILGILSFFIFKQGNSIFEIYGVKYIIFMIFFTFIAGSMIILGMIINSRLGNKIGVLHSTTTNYLIGFILLCILCIFTKNLNSKNLNIFSHIPIWAYLGGILGVLVVAISNIVIPKIPAIYSTLIIFIGQLYTGMLIDFLINKKFSLWDLIGGLLITLGMLYNLYIDNYKKLKS